MSFERAVTIANKGMTFDIVRQSGLFPSIAILNSFFQCGVDDAASEVSIRWEPFTLNPAEYEQLIRWFKDSVAELEIDDLGFHAFADWFSAVALRNVSD